MTGRIPKGAAVLAATLLASCAFAASAMASLTEVTYNSIPSPLPGNVPSQAFEATSTSEFGAAIEPAAPSKTATKVVVGMSSWACQSGGAEDGSCVTAMGAKFEWPVTLKLYAVGPGNSVGTQVAQLTKTFKMPYRPSANPRCPTGGWYRSGNCFHGKLFKIGFTLRGVSLPSKTIVAVAYNTSDYGAVPQRPQSCNTSNNCPYDSLNVALTGTPSVGSQPLPDDAFLDSTWGGAYCDGGSGGTGSFRLDAGCWTGYQPMIEVITG
jgi:hypothetical protein